MAALELNQHYAKIKEEAYTSAKKGKERGENRASKEVYVGLREWEASKG
ncbi:hypothetical protein [Teredinibacter turnerae]|nr:hypothetical protein [Teredinibacter turnerae]